MLGSKSESALCVRLAFWCWHACGKYGNSARDKHANFVEFLICIEGGSDSATKVLKCRKRSFGNCTLSAYHENDCEYDRNEVCLNSLRVRHVAQYGSVVLVIIVCVIFHSKMIRYVYLSKGKRSRPTCKFFGGHLVALERWIVSFVKLRDDWVLIYFLLRSLDWF